MFADAHNDTLTLAFKEKKDLMKNDLHFDFERAKKIGLLFQNMAVWQDTKYNNYDMVGYAINLAKQLDRYDAINIFTGCKFDVEKINVLLSIEDIAIINEIDQLYLLKDANYRLATLTWNHKTHIAGGAFTNQGLSRFGEDVLKQLLKLDFIVDLSHASYKTFYDAVNIIYKPFIVSHSNSYSLCNHVRNLKDDQIKIIKEYKGLIGINFYKPFLNATNNSTIVDIINHIKYIADIIGTDYICFGSDFDGAFEFPENINGIESLEIIKEYLQESGFTQKEVEQICYKNLINFVKGYYNIK
ncbi:dipeptidase [Caldicellulosiruptoraceae bacterium PP1]